MNLFMRLWLVATITASGSALAAVVAFAVIDEPAREAERHDEALTLARFAGHAASMDPLGSVTGAASTGLLRQRAAELMAIGPLLSVAIAGPDGAVVADLTTPGLEDERVLRAVPALFEEVARTRVRRLEHRDGIIYVVQPLTDRYEVLRGVLGLQIPADVIRRDSNDIVRFTGVAVVIAALLGLVAALVLTRRVARPIVRLARLAGRLDDPDFNTELPTSLLDRRDEIGQLARVMLRLVKALDHLGRQMDVAAVQPPRDRPGG